eukprot:COSAG06_NODE_3922_length_4763_cov_9.796312_1_plen_42_part_00
MAQQAEEEAAAAASAAVAERVEQDRLGAEVRQVQHYMTCQM